MEIEKREREKSRLRKDRRKERKEKREKQSKRIMKRRYRDKSRYLVSFISPSM